MSKELLKKINKINTTKYDPNELPELDKINDDEEFSKLFENYEFVVADMTAKWCGPCQRIKPEIQKLSQEKEFKHIKFIICDINDCDQEISLLEYVNVVPTFLLFKKVNDGYEIISAIEGADLNVLKNEVLVYMTDQLD